MVRVALLQLEVKDSIDEAIEHVVDLLKKVGSARSDIVCLPEQWYPKQLDSLDELKPLQESAIEYGMVIVSGAFYRSIDGNLYISCPVIGVDGSIIGEQFKLHPYGLEVEKVKAGDRLLLFEHNGVRFGVAICHDVVFPEVARALALNNADLIFFPSRIISEGIEPWHIYVKARALENRVPCIAPNLCSEKFGGMSIIVDLRYDEALDIVLPDTVVASGGEHVIISDIDVEASRRIRSIRMNELRKDYSVLIKGN
jgi:omega-amidase